MNEHPQLVFKAIIAETNPVILLDYNEIAII